MLDPYQYQTLSSSIILHQYQLTPLHQELAKTHTQNKDKLYNVSK
jgi:hypothetical protein